MALLGLAVAAACSSQEVAGRDAAGSPAAADAPSVGTGVLIAIDASARPRPDAQLAAPAGFTFPDPPVVACGGEFPDASCGMPAATCGQPECAPDGGPCLRPTWVAFLENPLCVNGYCKWDRGFYECSGFAICQQGGCYTSSPTLP